MSSPWSLLANATLIFDRVTSYSVDTLTGNRIPVFGQQYSTRVYFKKAQLNTNESKGIPVGSYKADGYTVEILPAWCKLSIQQSVRCVVDNLGSGRYYQQGKVHVVKSQVELAGQGTQLQGYLLIDGGANG